MSEEAALAVGSLETTPFADLLVHAFDHRLTGTLVLEEPSGSRHGVYFEAGTPRKVKTGAAVASLGEVLVQTGVISERVRERTLARALEEHLLHGRVLVGDGLISEHALALGLREQLLRQMLWLFERPQGTRYGYFDGSNFLENWGAESGSRISVMELLWRGFRDHARPAEIHAVLARLGGRAIVLREDMPLDYFYFMGSDRDVIELLSQRPQRLDELYQKAPSLRDVIERVVCLLLLTRSVDLGTRTAPPLGIETNVEATSWSLPSANVPSIPDLAEPPAEEAEQAAASSPIPMTEPEIDSQSDAPAPDSYSGSEAEQAREEAVLAAAAAFRKAEALIASGHLARAEAEARFALESEPGRAEHVALCAWIDVLKPGADVSRVMLELKRAMLLAENSVKAHWYRALTLQHLGRHDHALREFRTVLELDPGHLDAVRQIRVYEMRLEKSPKGRPSLAPEPESSGGWFRRRR
jgi:tetratricopeptide (TPR) repeat protein